MSDLRVAEFFCGIGGFHFALRRICPNAEFVAAFDIDKDGNRVYEHNTGFTPTQIDIGTLSVKALESLKANLWLCSPPCQPFTRQGHKRDIEDPRSASFLHLLKKLSEMETCMPEFICVENVVGFEQSEMHRRMLTAFRQCQLTAIQEFILSPDQFGIPYSRPRYFCLARREPFRVRSMGIIHTPPHFLDTSPPHQAERLPLMEFLEGEDRLCDSFAVPEKFLCQCSDVMNVVSTQSSLLNCFTKSYGGRYFKGTGSFLATKHSEWIPFICSLQSACCDGTWTQMISEQLKVPELEPVIRQLIETDPVDRRTEGCRILFELLKEMGIRYFTPKEVAALHSFPPEFQFPEGVSQRRQYALLGNSLSVAVVSALLQHLLSYNRDVTGD